MKTDEPKKPWEFDSLLFRLMMPWQNGNVVVRKTTLSWFDSSRYLLEYSGLTLEREEALDYFAHGRRLTPFALPR